MSTIIRSQTLDRLSSQTVAECNFDDCVNLRHCCAKRMDKAHPKVNDRVSGVSQVLPLTCCVDS